MNMKHIALVSLTLSLVGVGCSRNATEESTTPARTSTADNTAGGSASRQQALNDGDQNCQLQEVYFAFDSADLDPRAREQLAANAQCLRVKRDVSVTLVGMTDPRGTEEYNLALGDRRARSAAQYMGSLGVESNRVGVHSVGEEHASGRDEASWARDRRASIQPR
ncbi:MAG: OmpA family protein [Myxococcales bacterium]|nr:OmpA family protein [Myxococcales bacterium]